MRLLNGCKVLQADVRLTESEVFDGVVLADRGEQYGFERYVTWRVAEVGIASNVFDAHSGNYFRNYEAALNDFYERR